MFFLEKKGKDRATLHTWLYSFSDSFGHGAVLDW